MLSNLNEVRGKFEDSMEIKFLISYIECEVFNNKFRALHSIEEAKERAGGWKFEFLNYHYLRYVEKKLENEDRLNNERKSVDVNKFYDFEMGFGELQQLMEDNTYRHSAFWELLKSPKVTKQKVYEKGVEITEQLEDIRSKFGELERLNPSNVHCMVLYSNFMRVIANNGEVWEQCQEGLEGIKRAIAQAVGGEEVEKEKYGENSVSGVIIISGERSNIGIIKHCSTKVMDLISYAPHRLIGQNINIIMPKFIGNMHDDVLRNYLEMSQSQYDFVERLVPMVDANNFMVFSRILTKPLPSLLNGLELVGIFNTVSESCVHHPNEEPKYVLYRADTGHVQAMSESCSKEFHYRINKIDQFNETSSELTFPTLFVDLREGAAGEREYTQCSILAKKTRDGDMEEVPVDVRQRLQINYYSVDLKMMVFYNQRAIKAEDTLNNTIIQDPIRASFDKTGRLPDRDKQVREKYLHEMARKDSLLTKEPGHFRAMQVLGIVGFIVAYGLLILFVGLQSGRKHTDNHLRLSMLGGEVLGDMCEVNYNARMMHMAAQYSTLRSKFDEFRLNVSSSVSSLQNRHFEVSSIYLPYQQDSSTMSEWAIDTLGQLSSENQTLKDNILSYITAANSHDQATITSFDFPLPLLANATNITATFINAFKVRYNGLFVNVPEQERFLENSSGRLLSFLEEEQFDADLQLGVTIGVYALIVGLITPLAMVMVSLIEGTMIILGHLTGPEIDKEIENCNSFLQVFYKDSYLVHLKNKQGNNEVHNPSTPISANPSLQASFLEEGQKDYLNSRTGPVMTTEHELITPREPVTKHSLKQAVVKIESLEK